MAKINDKFLRLSPNYLFTDIARKVGDYMACNPQADIIRLGIGDVTQPLVPVVIEAMHKAVEEMGRKESFRGYAPEHGYDFLREAIIQGDFLPRGVDIRPEEIFVNDGAKSDTGNISDILGENNVVCMTDPIYPVYMDSNVMAGRKIVSLSCTAENEFQPSLPSEYVDVIYLCYPNNPTGTTLTRPQLALWVEYALEHDALIFYDAAYEAYIREENIPHTIYEIPGARRCAIEFHSYSKTAGFTGIRCGYTVVPSEVTAFSRTGQRVSLNGLWNRRQCTKFNGTGYVQQRAAEATYSAEGQRQIREVIDYYMENARIMREGLEQLGYVLYGGVNAPYLFLQSPDGMTSWAFFEHLLRHHHIVGTPGVGFGACGEGYLRLTAFGNREDCLRAMERMTLNTNERKNNL